MTRLSTTLTNKPLTRHSPQTFVRIPDFILVYLKTLNWTRNNRIINWTQISDSLIHNSLSLVIIVSQINPHLRSSGTLRSVDW